MRNWTGFLLLVAAVWLIHVSLGQRRRVQVARRAAAERGESAEAATPHPSLAMLGDILPPLVMLALAIVAAQIVLAYLVMGGGRLFSVFDLVAFLLLLAAYGFWMIVKTQYREPASVDGSREAAPSSRPVG